MCTGNWEAITTSDITLPNAGSVTLPTPGSEGTGDFARVNINQWLGVIDGKNPMVSDNEDTNPANGNGDIFDALGLPIGVLGVATLEFVITSTATITEGFAIFNGPSVNSGDTTGVNFRGVMTHELGHFLNFAHSVVNGQAFLFGGSDAVLPDGTGRDICNGGSHLNGDTATACETVTNVP